MNSLIVYYSRFGNTREIAEAVGETLGAAGPAQVISTDQLGVSDLEEAELVVLGSPTHQMKLPEVVRPVFESLPRRVLPGTPAAVFDTSYKLSRWLAPFTAAPKLASWLRKLGGKRLVPPETFHVEGREGPLYAGEIERARAWANSILKQLEEVSL
ncbi:MAG: flavodoxin family protein [Anaerolineae bacterium]|jgi:flavodoxin